MSSELYMTNVNEEQKSRQTSSVYDCTVEDVEYIYNKFSLYTELVIYVFYIFKSTVVDRTFFFLISPAPDHLVSWIIIILSCVLASSWATPCILPVLCSVFTCQVPIYNLLLVFLCTRFRLRPINRPVPFLHWESSAYGCFMWKGSWPFAKHPTWRTRMPVFVWAITLVLSGLGDPASSYVTACLAPWIIWPHKPQLCVKVDTSSRGSVNH